MNDCIFCKISKRELPAKLVYEDPELFAFEDIAPQAPTHILICSRKHLETLADSKEQDGALLGRTQAAGLSCGGEQRPRRGADRLPPAFPSAGRARFPLAAGVEISRRSRQFPHPDTEHVIRKSGCHPERTGSQDASARIGMRARDL